MVLAQLEYPVAYFGALAAGATVALIPVQQEMSETDIAMRLLQSKVKLLADCACTDFQKCTCFYAPMTCNRHTLSGSKT